MFRLSLTSPLRFNHTVHKYRLNSRKKSLTMVIRNREAWLQLVRSHTTAILAIPHYLFSSSPKYFSKVVGSLIERFGCSGTVLLSITACVISQRLLAVFSVKPTDKSVSIHLFCGIDWTAMFLLSSLENVLETSSELYFCCPVSS